MTRTLSWKGFFLRWLFAIVLVFLTWNPHGYSLVDYIIGSEDLLADWPIKLIIGIILLIGWSVYINATMNALGTVGLFLVIMLFVAIIGALYYYDIVAIGFNGLFLDLVLILVSLLLAIGMSWSHVNRRMTGQVDTDDVET